MPETGGLQDWRLEIADCRLQISSHGFILASKLAVVMYRKRARRRFLLLVTSEPCLTSLAVKVKFGAGEWVGVAAT
jgi:hypothetical protein